jgi:hypothetical protein
MKSRKKAPAMTEFYTAKRIDNSRVVRHVEPAKMQNLYRTAALGGVVAMFFLFYIYQHFRCIDLSFQLEAVRAKQAEAASLNSALKLEIAGLRDPNRCNRPEAIGFDGNAAPASARVRNHSGRASGSGSGVCALRAAQSRSVRNPPDLNQREFAVKTMMAQHAKTRLRLAVVLRFRSGRSRNAGEAAKAAAGLPHSKESSDS